MEKKKRVLKGSAHASPEKRRAELLQAAINCFGREGYFSTTIDHIAKEAGLSKGSVYRFFKSKDDVLIAIMGLYEEEVYKILQVEYAATKNPREEILVTFRTIIAYLSQHSEMERTWQEFGYHQHALEEYSRILQEFRDDLEQMLHRGITQELFIDQDTAPVIDILVSFQEGLLEFSSSHPDFDALERFDACWPMLERVYVKSEFCTLT